MPMPMPQADEDEAAFMERCMGNQTMLDDFPENDQRSAVCMSLWDDTNASARDIQHKTKAAPPPGNDPLEYVMSDGSIDRVGDIIEPKGWNLDSFRKNPIALFNHNPDFPIGTWKDVRVEGGALKGRLVLPPPESERQRELQGFVKAGVLRAVSVGFSAEEAEPIKESKAGGIRFKKQELLECSLVGIPANANALQIAKSLGASDEIRKLVFQGTELQAEPGRMQSGITTRSAHAGASKPISIRAPTKMAKKTLAEQIAQLEASRQAKASRMEELVLKAAEEDRTSDEAETEEFDTLADEVDAIDKELVKIRRLEKAMASTAKAVIGHNSQAASESRDVGERRQHVTFMQRQLPPGIAFARLVRCCLAGGGIPVSALGVAEKQYPDMDDLHMILRAAVAAGSTQSNTWAGDLVQYQDMQGEFVEYMRPMTVIGRIPGLRNVPFNIRVPRQTSGGAAYWVGEGQPKPLTSFAFDTITMRFTKIANIAVLTDEVVRFSTPAVDAIVRDQLAAALVQQMDTDFLDPANSGTTDVKPASITNGISATASSGTTADDVRTDVVALLNKFATNNIPTDGLVWIGNDTTRTVLEVMMNAMGQPEFPGIDNGRLFGRPYISTQVIAASGSPATSILVLLRPQDILIADDGRVNVDASREASLQMLDNPTNAVSSGSPSAPTATTMVSMFQTNAMALRAEREINWTRARTAAVQYLSGVAYAV